MTDEAEAEKKETPATEDDDSVEELRGNPIRLAMDKLVNGVRDIEDCAHFISTVRAKQDAEQKTLAEELNNVNKSISEFREKTGIGKLEGYITEKLLYAVRKATRLSEARPDRVMASSLFLGLFATVDAYVGDLLRALFRQRRELFNQLGHDVPFEDILAASSIEDIKLSVLEEFIDKFRRDSYVEQFETMERMFSIKLRQFTRWPNFVEASQRRNVIAHCDGVVTKQYVDNCSRAACDIPTILTVGSVAEVTEEYLITSGQLIMEVGIKLGQTLWRKLLPLELEVAERHLQAVTYNALRHDEWSWAAVLGEFAIGQPTFTSDLIERIAIVNYAIAIRYRDNPEAGRKVMAKKDWSASSPEFRLAEAVLNDDDILAGKIMQEIGLKGSILEGESSYQTWPLFRDFRNTTTFLQTYQKIYRHDFFTELQRETTDSDEHRLTQNNKQDE
jgi:hypothetical protein